MSDGTSDGTSAPSPEDMMSDGSAEEAEARDANHEDADQGLVSPGSTAGKNPPPGGDGVTPDADLQPDKV